jgi:hypothetical protein
VSSETFPFATARAFLRVCELPCSAESAASQTNHSPAAASGHAHAPLRLRVRRLVALAWTAPYVFAALVVVTLILAVYTYPRRDQVCARFGTGGSPFCET